MKKIKTTKKRTTMKQKIFTLLAAVLLSSANLFAQSSEGTTYYWYAGQIKPTSMSTKPTPSDEYLCNNWFELGEEMPSELHKLIKGGTQNGGSWYVAVPYANNQTYYPGYPNIIDNSVPWTDEYIEVNGISYHIFEYGGVMGATRNSFMLQKFDESLFIVIPPFYVIKYGDEIPDLSEQSYRVINTAGKTLSNPLVLTTEATSSSPVGGYEIFVDRSLVEEEVLFYKTPWINIRKAPLTVGVQDVTIAEGEQIPIFTLTYDGFKNNETDAVLTTKPTATTTATSSSKVGTYPITVSGGEAQNYNLTYVDGKLTVTEKESTSIKETEKVKSTHFFFNLQGHRTVHPSKGVNIVGRRKLIVK